MPTIYVDGIKIEAPADTNLLEALLSKNINVPYFCWHPAMGSIGACRQCAVLQYANEDDTRGRIVMSCMTPITEGARFSVAAENASMFRDSVVENLMLNHPHDCPVCEEGGECHLQDMTVLVGHRDRRYKGLKTTFKNQYLGPFIGHEMNRCITCYRCVRYYQDYAGGEDLAAFASRDRVFFGRAEPGILENEFSGNLVEVCPTGVFTDKTLSKHYTRKWDLQSAPTICQACSAGCNTYTSERYGEIRRVHNRYHSEVNGYFLCDRGRFGAQHVNSNNRIPQAGRRNAIGTYDRLMLDTALEEIKNLVAQGSIAGIGSPRASLEANAALRELVGAENYCNGMSQLDQTMHQVICDVLASQLNSPTIREIEDCDAILILGEDLTNHAPRLALSVRQAARNKGIDESGGVGIAQWHDAAVRELTQADRSPIIIATPMADRLDDVANSIHRLSPGNIAAFAAAITSSLVEGSNNSDSNISSGAALAADLLRGAKKPLIISGTSLQNLGVLQAAANLAIALTSQNADTQILLCSNESNSIGVAMMDNQNTIEQVLNGQPKTLVVLENDLDLRLGHAWRQRINDVENLVVLDFLDTHTVSASDFILPAATFAESEGTFVNLEGRAQRSIAVFKPAGEITASHHLLTELNGQRLSSTDIRSKLTAEVPALAAIVDCAPDSDFRVEGSKIPRMTHRASGRTAMFADVSVHEPKQPEDADSAMAFTMEGNQAGAPSSLRAYTWAPGWNSNQSIHKFQSEVAGPDKTGDPGIRLFQHHSDLSPYTIDASAGQIIAQHHIFGSDPVTNHAVELATRIPQAYLMMNSAMALGLGVEDRGGVACEVDSIRVELRVLIDESVADGCLVYPKIDSTLVVASAQIEDFTPIQDWQGPVVQNPVPVMSKPGNDPSQAQLITSDRTN